MEGGGSGYGGATWRGEGGPAGRGRAMNGAGMCHTKRGKWAGTGRLGRKQRTGPKMTSTIFLFIRKV
jgi:hypothetical protein